MRIGKRPFCSDSEKSMIIWVEAPGFSTSEENNRFGLLVNDKIDATCHSNQLCMNNEFVILYSVDSKNRQLYTYLPVSILISYLLTRNIKALMMFLKVTTSFTRKKVARVYTKFTFEGLQFYNSGKLKTLFGILTHVVRVRKLCILDKSQFTVSLL